MRKKRIFRSLCDHHVPPWAALEILQILTESHRSAAVRYPLPSYRMDCFESVDSLRCFRFLEEELGVLCRIIGYDRDIWIPHVRTVPGIFAVRVCLLRLATAQTYAQMAQLTCISPSHLSEIVTYVLRDFEEILGKAVNMRAALLADRIPVYLEAVLASGSPLRVWGFMDCTARRIPKPVPRLNPDDFYDGHHHMYSVKFLTVVAPDGLVIFSSEMFSGRRNDAEVYRRSELENRLGAIERPRSSAILSDGGFGRTDFVFSMPRRIEEEQLDIHGECETLRELRLVVEHHYGLLLQNFPIPNKLRLGKGNIDCVWTSCLAFSNLQCVIRNGNRITQYFREYGVEIDPPPLEVYLDE